MDDTFDPYREWLEIDCPERPPNHYHLLGIKEFETDREAIENALAARTARVEEFQAKSPGQMAAKLLTQIAEAGECLLDARERSGYNALVRSDKMQRGREPKADDASLAQVAVGAAGFFLTTLKRVWVKKVTLRSAYRRLGRDVHKQNRNVESLDAQHKRVDARCERLAAIDSRRDQLRVDATKNRGFTGRVKRFYRRMVLLTETKLAERAKRRAMRELGRAAYEKEGIECGPEVLTMPVASALALVKRLDAKLQRLSEVRDGDPLTPKRLAWLIVIVAGLTTILLWWWFR